MQFLRSNGFPCPEMYAIKDDKDHEESVYMALVDVSGLNPKTNEDDKKEICVVRLIAFLKGNVVASIDRNPKLLYSVGKFVGSLCKVLKVGHFQIRRIRLIELPH